MFWWFERGGELLRLEVLQLTTDSFELRVIQDDGSETIENFSNASELAKRHVQVQDQVAKEGWIGPRGPLM
jgi:hypothetical protein